MKRFSVICMSFVMLFFVSCSKNSSKSDADMVVIGDQDQHESVDTLSDEDTSVRVDSDTQVDIDTSVWVDSDTQVDKDIMENVDSIGDEDTAIQVDSDIEFDEDSADQGDVDIPIDEDTETPDSDTIITLGEMVLITADTFQMGSPEGEPGRYSNEAQHTVTLTKDFYMNKYEVTQGGFRSLMGYNPSDFPTCGDNCPVEEVSWHEALAYANARSTAEGFEQCFDCFDTGISVTCSLKSNFVKPQDCKGYRLPTESEWEYAARGGATTAFYNGDITSTSGADPNLNLIGWYDQNSESKTHEVGGKLANNYGLYDMSGNVWEWSMDWYASSYPTGAVTDPVGAESGSYRVLRGGSWSFNAYLCRNAYRYFYTSTLRSNNLGFRLVRTQ